MKDVKWILLDTETTGFAAPVFVVELAAQWMQGWESTGATFRKLLNQNADMPAEASGSDSNVSFLPKPPDRKSFLKALQAALRRKP